ncbi:kinase-like domain-containing protein [Mycena galericulata]|nr:kinase-like domain-containing protein [Mycena galericulata]
MTSRELDLSTVDGVHAYLSATPFASTLVTPLGGVTKNFTYRLHLETPYETRSTVVLKHARAHTLEAPEVSLGIERQGFEVQALKLVNECLNLGPRATVPGVYHFDEEAHVIIMDYCGESSLTLKELLLSSPPTPVVAREIGLALGEFLGRLHAWGSLNPSMLDFFEKNEQAKKVAAWITYGRLISTLTTDNLPAVALLPEPVCESDLDDIRAIIEERTPEIYTSRDTLTMGNFCPANVFVSLRTGTGTDSLDKVHVIDWELAKPGVAALDVGQFCAEMHTVALFKPASDTAASANELIDAFLTAYRAHCGEIKPHMPNVAAKHMGAHLVAITPRAGWGTPGETAKVVEAGVTHLMEGCSDRWVRERSVLNPLM